MPLSGASSPRYALVLLQIGFSYDDTVKYSHGQVLYHLSMGYGLQLVKPSCHYVGSTAQQAKGQAPPCEKQVTAELGCVTPYIIVPGKWTRSDMEYYASEIVSGLVNNAGHNCTKVEVLVTDGSWPQRDEFLVILR